MENFNPKWRDFPHFIIGITKEIWEDRRIALLEDCYHSDIIVRGAGGLKIGCQAVIDDTLAKMAAFPDLQILAEDVIWSGGDDSHYLSSHRTVPPHGLKGGAPLNIGYTPYLFKSKEWAEKILNGPIFDEMFENLAKESGVRAFAAAGARSGRAIQTTKGPIVKPEDLKGYRLRIPPIDMFRAAFEPLGVKVVPMGLSDVYLAMSRGMYTAVHAHIAPPSGASTSSAAEMHARSSTPAVGRHRRGDPSQVRVEQPGTQDPQARVGRRIIVE